jgi:hypothetical protein
MFQTWVLSIASVVLVPHFSWAQEPTPNPTPSVKSASQPPTYKSAPALPSSGTTTPPKLGVPLNPEHLYVCERKIEYQGKLLNCDSHLGYDGDNLRPIIDGVPEAMKSLDRYQKRQRAVKDLAYIGSLGLGMVLVGNLFFQGNKPVRNTLIFSGLGVTVGSFTIGLVTLQQNEKVLMKAIDQHNQARPSTPIQAIFTTGAQF